MGGNSGLGSGGSFGGAGQPGFISPFTSGAFNTGAESSLGMMANRYNQLGMTGSTPEAQDLGLAPSITGGIPAEFQAGQGQLQTQDLGQTSSSAGSALQSKNNQIGAIGQGAGLLGGLF
jgi:hypothetical protein